jgi:hypothetical protein
MSNEEIYKQLSIANNKDIKIPKRNWWHSYIYGIFSHRLHFKAQQQNPKAQKT